MKGNTLHNYDGKMVNIRTSLGRGGCTDYIGKISIYDNDFITLNPFIHATDFHRQSESFQKSLIKTQAGTTDHEITIGRRYVVSIQKF